MFKSPDWLERYVEWTDDSEPSELYRIWSGLFAVSAVLGRKVWLDYENIFHANLFVLLIGGPASRKGTAINPARQLVTDAGVILSADVSSPQAFVAQLQSNPLTFNHPDTDKLITHHSLSVVSAEFGVFMSTDPETTAQWFCDFYDCRDDFTYHTKKDGMQPIPNLFVSLLGATTPTALLRCLPKSTFGDGFASRIVLVWSGKASCKPGRPSIRQRTYKNKRRIVLLDQLKAIGGLTGEFQPTKEYMEAFDAWYENQHEHQPPILSSEENLQNYCGRRQTIVRKMSMCCSAARSLDLKLTLDDFTLAKSILELTEKYMPLCFKDYINNNIGSMVNKIKNELARAADGLTYTQIYEHCHQHATPDEIEKALKVLQQLGYVRKHESNTGTTYKYTKPLT